MRFFKKVALDLGTANTRLSVLGERRIYREPTVVAVSLPGEDAVGVGEQAKKMLGKTPLNISARYPLRSGVVADFKMTTTLLRQLFVQALGRARLFKPDVIISAPASLSSIENDAVLDVAISAGARHAHLFPAVLAGALGAEVAVGAPSGSLVISLGGSLTEIALISLGSVVVADTFKIGGDLFTRDIASFIREEYQLVIGIRVAERLKLFPGRDAEVKGISLKTKTPAVISLPKDAVYQAVAGSLSDLADYLAGFMERVPPELASDVLDKGAVLIGGFANFKGIDTYLAERLGLPVHIADDPGNCVVRGLKLAYSNFPLFSKSFSGER